MMNLNLDLAASAEQCGLDAVGLFIASTNSLLFTDSQKETSTNGNGPSSQEVAAEKEAGKDLLDELDEEMQNENKVCSSFTWHLRFKDAQF